MTSLTDKQIKFLDDLARGPKGLREVMDDHDLGRHDFKAWQEEPAFAEALEEVFAWLELVREVDVRVGATEALRRQRMNLCGGGTGDFYLSARQRQVGNDLWNKARQLDKKFPRHWSKPGTPRQISPIHPDNLKEADAIIKRMQELREEALAARAAAKHRAIGAAGAEARLLPEPTAALSGAAACEEPGGKEGSD